MLAAAGEDYVRYLLEAFWSNPATWARTAFIIVYDENDGLFDHVVPPTAPPGTPDEYVAGLPIGLGFRVPCFVISPFSRGGFVCGEMFDHTSTLRFIEKRFGVEVPNLTQWRRDTCGDLTAAFAFGEPADLSIPKLPDTAGPLADVVRRLNSPILPRPAAPSRQSMPKQEAAGIVRRRRA
jgi:phospholipase C